jgi:hypothetical protein
MIGLRIPSPCILSMQVLAFMKVNLTRSPFHKLAAIGILGKESTG